MNYAQGDTHYPHFQESEAALPNVWVLVANKYGQLWDFTDLIFRTSGSVWTKKSGEMVKNDAGLWTYNTGWLIPSGINLFHCSYRDVYGTHYRGETLNVTISGSGGGAGGDSAATIWAYGSRTLTQTVGTSTLTFVQLQQAHNEYGGLRPSVSGRAVDVSPTGEVGVDWANIGSPNTEVSLGGTTIRGSGMIISNATTLDARIPSALVGGRMDSNVSAIDDNNAAAVNLKSSTLGIVTGVVGSGSTTTSIVTSSLAPSASATDQFKGKIVTFAEDTTSTNLRGQSTDITASTSGGVLTVTALTHAPVSGDTFAIT